MYQPKIDFVEGYLRSRVVTIVETVGSQSPDESVSLTRALAAWSVHYLTGVDVETAVSSVIDGFHDRGIDAIHYDENRQRLYFVQSKWTRGRGTISKGDMLKFLDGVNAVLQGDIQENQVNNRLWEQLKDVRRVCDNAYVSIELVVVYSSSSNMGNEVEVVWNSQLGRYRTGGTTANKHLLNLNIMFLAMTNDMIGPPIDVKTTLKHWGEVDEPQRAIYGRVNAAEVAAWHGQYGGRLFSSNPRFFLGSTEVNTEIETSLLDDPEHFWYMNNGITALCSKYRRSPWNAGSTDENAFLISDLRIVNGAQTVGAIARAYNNDPEQVKKAEVHIRFIELERQPAGGLPSLQNRIVVANNRQNELSRREFIALDDWQERLQLSFELMGIEYCYKQGMTYEDQQCGFDLDEATIAQACFCGLEYAAIASNDIDALWEDTNRSPYRTVFPHNLDPMLLWKRVQIVRRVEADIAALSENEDDANRLRILRHGTRFLIHQVAKRCQEPEFLAETTEPDEQLLRDILFKAVQYTTQAKQSEFANIRDEVFFSNVDACIYLDAQITLDWEQPTSPDELDQINEILKNKPIFD